MADPAAAVLAALADFESRSERRLALLHDRVTHLTLALIHLAKGPNMSAATDAIKADLADLEDKVDKAIAAAGDIGKDAIAAEEADLAGIKAHIVAIGAKVEGMVPAVAAAVAPSAAAAAHVPAEGSADSTTS